MVRRQTVRDRFKGKAHRAELARLLPAPVCRRGTILHGYKLVPSLPALNDARERTNRQLLGLGAGAAWLLHRVRVGCAALLQGAIQRDGQHLYIIHRGHRRGCALYHSSSAATATYVTAVASNTAITTFAAAYVTASVSTPDAPTTSAPATIAALTLVATITAAAVSVSAAAAATATRGGRDAAQHHRWWWWWW